VAVHLPYLEFQNGQIWEGGLSPVPKEAQAIPVKWSTGDE